MAKHWKSTTVLHRCSDIAVSLKFIRNFLQICNVAATSQTSNVSVSLKFIHSFLLICDVAFSSKLDRMLSQFSTVAAVLQSHQNLFIILDQSVMSQQPKLGRNFWSISKQSVTSQQRRSLFKFSCNFRPICDVAATSQFCKNSIVIFTNL